MRTQKGVLKWHKSLDKLWLLFVTAGLTCYSFPYPQQLGLLFIALIFASSVSILRHFPADIYRLRHKSNQTKEEAEFLKLLHQVFFSYSFPVPRVFCAGFLFLLGVMIYRSFNGPISEILGNLLLR